MTKPTVGRKVWYSPRRTDGAKLGEQPFDATIIYVHNDKLVNLAVRSHTGVDFNRDSVPLLQDGDAPLPEGGHCSWPVRVA